MIVVPIQRITAGAVAVVSLLLQVQQLVVASAATTRPQKLNLRVLSELSTSSGATTCTEPIFVHLKTEDEYITAATPGFFVDSVGGDDSNSGRSAAAAWRSLEPVRTAKLQPGDSVRFKRGGVWRADDDSLKVPGVGAPGAPITFTSYGDPNLPKPLLLGSKAVGGAANWTAVPGKPGLWRTLPDAYEPAAGATNVFREPNFEQGGKFWSAYTGCPVSAGPCSTHVHGSVNTTAHGDEYILQFNDMKTGGLAHVQFFTFNVSVVNGATYNVSFRAKATHGINVSGISCFAMAPPYTPYAAGTGPIYLPGGDDWTTFSVRITATETANDARVTWWFGPDITTDTVVRFQSVSMLRVVSVHPNRVKFLTDVGNLVLFKDSTTQPVAGFKRWAAENVTQLGDFYFDRGPGSNETLLLTTWCDLGPPDKCWPGGIEAVMDHDVLTQDGGGHVVIEDLDLRYAGQCGYNGVMAHDVLTYEHDYGRGVPVRSGNGIQFWQGAQNVEVYNNRLWQIYDTPLTNQGIGCVAGGGTPEACAMTNISWHHNLVTTNAMACVEVWYVDNQTTMSSVRFENNLCANTGDLGWSANQRPDPAGRVFCAYHNSAITTNLSVVNNVFIQTAGWEAMMYVSDPYNEWAEQGMTFENNVLYATQTIPPSPRGPTSVGNEHAMLKTAGNEHYTAGNWSLFTHKYGAGQGTLFTDPMLHGLRNLAGGAAITIELVTGATPEPNSPVIQAGRSVIWRTDYNGVPIPADRPDIGPFQHIAYR